MNINKKIIKNIVFDETSHVLEGQTKAQIDSDTTGKAAVTKEWVEDFYTSITGYDAGETQTLKHVNGVLQWVTD